jgi:hypothetical protein
MEDHKDKKIVKASVNCKLEVSFNPKNKIIYVCPRKPQYFLVTSSKCCGQVSIKYTGCNYDCKTGQIIGDLGCYTLYDSGIVIHPFKNIHPGEIDTLNFTAKDDCSTYDFTVIFAYAPCECCKESLCK